MSYRGASGYCRSAASKAMAACLRGSQYLEQDLMTTKTVIWLFWPVACTSIDACVSAPIVSQIRRAKDNDWYYAIDFTLLDEIRMSLKFARKVSV